MTLAAQVGAIHREQTTNQAAMDFAHMARFMLLGKGNANSILTSAKTGRANERIVEGIKALASAGTTTDGTWAAPLAYQELSDGFLGSLRNHGLFDSALPFALQIPLNTQAVITT